MKNNEQKVMLTGVRPSGNLTLGNYLGAIKNFVTRQNQYKSYIFVADLHAITSPRNPAELRAAVNDCIAVHFLGPQAGFDCIGIFLNFFNV